MSKTVVKIILDEKPFKTKPLAMSETLTSIREKLKDFIVSFKAKIQ